MKGNKGACNKCHQRISDRKYLSCADCKQLYDLFCANVSEHRFYNTLTGEHRDAWKCALCMSKQPKMAKTNITNTPVRSANSVTVQRGGAIQNESLDMSVVSEQSDTCDDTTHNMTIELSEFQLFVLEMRSFRDEIREELKANRLYTERLNDTIIALSHRVTECESRVNAFEERLNNLERKTEDGSSFSTCIENLQMELNEREQESLLNDVEVSCIPEQKGESLSHIMTVLAKKLGVELVETDIVTSERVGRIINASKTSEPSRPRPIVMRLARRAVRDKLLQAARVRREATTEGTSLPGSPNRFYINERLTKTNRQLFRHARELAKRLKWRYVWTKNGRIFVRQHQSGESPRLRLRTEADLSRVFGQDVVGSSLSAQVHAC
ncbi:hypothetical protein ACJJTC_008887 [Scirpophaga incertulas]